MRLLYGYSTTQHSFKINQFQIPLICDFSLNLDAFDLLNFEALK